MLKVEDLKPEVLKRVRKYNKFYSKKIVEKGCEISQKIRETYTDESFYQSYFNIVKRTAEIIDHLDIKDPISSSVVFEHLLWNGYLSKDHKLVYSIAERNNNVGVLGADIMLGKSVCLNNAVMLTDILKELGKEAYTFTVYVPTNFIEKSYELEIERIQSNSTSSDKFLKSLFKSLIIKRVGNHAVTLVKMNNGIIVSDPTTLEFLNISNFLRAKFVGNDLEIDIKPLFSLTLNEFNKDILDSIIIDGYLMSDEVFLTLDEVKEKSELAMEICKSSQDTLEKFYESNEKDIDIVCRTLRKK